MPQYEQKKPHRRPEEDAPPPEPAAQERQDKLDADVNEILDEIDQVLEVNAAEFVRGYIQKGGQ